MQDQIVLKGELEIVLTHPDGSQEVTTLRNLVTTIGKEVIADRLLASPAKAVPTHMAIGTGTEEAKVGDTKLKTELDRNALTEKTRSGKVLTMIGEWAAGDGTGAITEAGVLNAGSEGELITRTVFTVINKGAEDTLKITWKLTIE
jgi:hypothetical protein